MQAGLERERGVGVTQLQLVYPSHRYPVSGVKGQPTTNPHQYKGHIN